MTAHVEETRTSLSVEQVGVHAAALSITEIGLGSTLHALHVPFAGSFLSLNQIFLLTRHLLVSEEQGRSSAPFSISAHAALMKSLSPMGKRALPMLAICMQGLLYNVGIWSLGNTKLGRLLGALIASTWSSFQPLFVYIVLCGKPLAEAAHYFPWLKELFLGMLVLKGTLALLIVSLTPLLPISRFEKYLQFISRSSHAKSVPVEKPLIGALKDLCKPLFLFSLAITGFFLYYSQGISEGLLWGLLRPLALGFICFFMLRLIPRSSLFHNNS